MMRQLTNYGACKERELIMGCTGESIAQKLVTKYAGRRLVEDVASKNEWQCLRELVGVNILTTENQPSLVLEGGLAPFVSKAIGFGARGREKSQTFFSYWESNTNMNQNHLNLVTTTIDPISI